MKSFLRTFVKTFSQVGEYAQTGARNISEFIVNTLICLTKIIGRPKRTLFIQEWLTLKKSYLHRKVWVFLKLFQIIQKNWWVSHQIKKFLERNLTQYHQLEQRNIFRWERIQKNIAGSDNTVTKLSQSPTEIEQIYDGIASLLHKSIDNDE